MEGFIRAISSLCNSSYSIWNSGSFGHESATVADTISTNSVSLESAFFFSSYLLVDDEEVALSLVKMISLSLVNINLWNWAVKDVLMVILGFCGSQPSDSCGLGEIPDSISSKDLRILAIEGDESGIGWFLSGIGWFLFKRGIGVPSPKGTTMNGLFVKVLLGGAWGYFISNKGNSSFPECIGWSKIARHPFWHNSSNEIISVVYVPRVMSELGSLLAPSDIHELFFRKLVLNFSFIKIFFWWIFQSTKMICCDISCSLLIFNFYIEVLEKQMPSK